MSDDDLHDDEQPIRSEAYGYFRDEPLDTAACKEIRKQLPEGAELVEGDFADDEKWRIISPEQAPVEPVHERPDAPPFAKCVGCGEDIFEDEPRVSDQRGSFHPEHYEKVEPTKKHLHETYGALTPDEQKRLGYSRPK